MALTVTNLLQTILRFCFGFTRRQMNALLLILRWTDQNGESIIKTCDLIAYNSLPNLNKFYPLLPVYVQRVPTTVKGILSFALQATHAVEDFVRRLLQTNDLKKWRGQPVWVKSALTSSMAAFTDLPIYLPITSSCRPRVRYSWEIVSCSNMLTLLATQS